MLVLWHLPFVVAGSGFLRHPLHEAIAELRQIGASLQPDMELLALLPEQTLAVRLGRRCSFVGDGIRLDAIQRQVAEQDAQQEV